jgi:hypothetical protein
MRSAPLPRSPLRSALRFIQPRLPLIFPAPIVHGVSQNPESVNLLRHLAGKPGHDEVKADFRRLLVTFHLPRFVSSRASR